MSLLSLSWSNPEIMKLKAGTDRGHGKVGAALVLSLVLTTTTVARGAELTDEQPDVAVAPGLQAEILEMAINHCLRGEAVQARALFKAIREQLDQPAEVIDRISRLEASGCPAPAVSPAVRWAVQLGAGYDNNVNQGIAAQSLILGSGLNAIELELGDTYKPRASSFAVAGMDTSFRLGDFAVGQVSLQHRENSSLPELNITGLLVAAIRPFSWLDRPGRVQIDLGETWLGGSGYQRAAGAGVQWLLAAGEQPWLANLTTLQTRYTSQPEQDSQLTEAGIWREKMFASKFGVFGGVSVLYDHALGPRPGGDRAGWRFQLGVTTGWSDWLIQPRLNVLRWSSSDVYSPGLIDVVRRHQLAQFDVQLVRPIAPGQQMVVEWRVNAARDAVPLFSYRGQILGVYWRLQR